MQPVSQFVIDVKTFNRIVIGVIMSYLYIIKELKE